MVKKLFLSTILALIITMNPALKLSPAKGKDDGEQRDEFELLLAQVQGHDGQL